jgi:hypothetical protein
MNGRLPGWSLSNARCVAISSIRPHRLCVSSSTNPPSCVALVARSLTDRSPFPAQIMMMINQRAGYAYAYRDGGGEEEGRAVVDRIRRRVEVDARLVAGANPARRLRSTGAGSSVRLHVSVPLMVMFPLGPNVAAS